MLDLVPEAAMRLENEGDDDRLGIREQALYRVGYIVARAFHELCFPFAIPRPGARGLDQMDTGWGFSSLGGAIFLQLYQVLSAQSGITRCEQCKKMIFGARADKRFCSGRCRANHYYQSGNGARRKRRKEGTS